MISWNYQNNENLIKLTNIKARSFLHLTQKIIIKPILKTNSINRIQIKKYPLIKMSVSY